MDWTRKREGLRAIAGLKSAEHSSKFTAENRSNYAIQDSESENHQGPKSLLLSDSDYLKMDIVVKDTVNAITGATNFAVKGNAAVDIPALPMKNAQFERNLCDTPITMIGPIYNWVRL